ncbi:MBL fold metallo-hydrolase [Ramlibacter solisilvae]|uniref:Beta-lactamase n=1 Tax=Ramlibacter tataouinensis TaxID=94132 RepID=A0A127JNY0_9BURK|nr:MBL fold metallo-hydrolase [Ramlibacter tataouinensis]AMO21708.1 beta-lactamase [Ramlibacter tataouinensis]
MSIELFRNDNHAVLMFTDLVEEDGQAVQSNQFLIVDHGVGAIIDPGGNLAYNELFVTISRFFPPQSLSYLIASHADPDIIAALDRWMTSTRAKLVISRIWERFAPHFTKAGKTEGRVIGVPDAGGCLQLGENELWLLPAHFMHSEGNFHFWDPVSRILFTGDLGVSLMSGAEAARPVTDLSGHIARMEGFHRRYMVSNKILRLWVRMARQLPIRMIVPQHGAPIEGKHAIHDFFEWIENLMCGVDLFDDRAYQLPTGVVDGQQNRVKPLLRAVG